jgi:DNA-binding transcriptional ArsR family regulator
VKLPNGWIEAGGLKEFKWGPGVGSRNVAALILLAVIAHHTDTDTGIARVTYDELGARASLSRSMIAAGLKVLEERGLVVRNGRSIYQLSSFNPNERWAKLPAAGLYNNDSAIAFREFQKRKRVELDALKLYFLIASRRSKELNLALLTYENMEARTGVLRHRIKHAITLLAAAGLIHIEHLPRRGGDQGIVSAYRLTSLDSYRHMGTTGRGVDPLDLEDFY